MTKTRAKKEALRSNHRPKLAPLSMFSRRLLREWRRLELSQAGPAVIVGVSGGADSVALLLGLDELVRGGKLDLQIIVAHLNHKLRGAHSDADARWVASLTRELGHPAVVKTVDVEKRAQKTKDNLEQAARRARYEFFAAVATSRKTRLVMTAHTMNDQAETILLNLIRGSGSDGLGGIEPQRKLSAKSEVVLARPLVSWARRRDTEAYCQLKSIDYRLDEMNFDESFSRVRVRKELLPLLEDLNPRFVENLTRNGEIFRQEGSALDGAATALFRQDNPPLAAQTLPAALLRDAPAGLRRRALRLWLGQQRGDLRRLEQAHIVAIEKLLLSRKSGRLIELPGGARVLRQNGMLHYRPRRIVK